MEIYISGTQCDYGAAKGILLVYVYGTFKSYSVFLMVCLVYLLLF